MSENSKDAELESSAEDQEPETNEETSEIQVEGADDTADQESAEDRGLNEKLLEYEDHLKRLQAEFENYRKRVQRDRQDTLKYSGQEVLTDLLSIKDNFDRALENKTDDEAVKPFFEGFEMINQQLNELLIRHNVEEIKGVGEEFNPNLHQSLLSEPSEEVEVDTVAEILLKGYSLHEKVLRAAQVKVSQAQK